MFRAEKESTLRKSLCASLAAAVLAWTAPTTAVAADLTVTVDQLVAYFDTIVFGAELDSRLANRVIAKWQKSPVTFSVEQRAKPEDRATIKGHLDALAEISGLAFRASATPETADIRILFLPTAQMGAIRGPNIDPEVIRLAATKTNCYFLSWKNPESRIVKALIVVNADRERAVLDSCLLEELTQSLGLPNDSDQMRPSIFSDRDRLYALAPQDRVLLFALYHPRMKAGLSRGQALKVAREIFTQLATPAEPTTSRGRGG